LFCNFSSRFIDNLVQVGARDKNYKFTNARVDVYPNKLKSNTFTLTLNRAQNKVFNAILVEVTKTIGSKKYKLKRNAGTSAIVISDKELTPELKKKIINPCVSKLIIFVPGANLNKIVNFKLKCFRLFSVIIIFTTKLGANLI
jgi:hypothetical protein